MAYLKTITTLDRIGLLAEDAVVNVMHWESDGAMDLADVDSLIQRIEDYYVTFTTRFSNSLAGTGLVSAYNMEDATPRVPIRQTAIAFSKGTSSLPGEVAVCLSYRAALVPGTNQARRRGRIFLGPWARTDAVVYDSPAQSDVSVGSELALLILDGAQDLMRGASGEFRLAVYSPTTDLSETLGDSFQDVTHYWVDNAFDIIRSRGRAATSKTVEALT